MSEKVMQKLTFEIVSLIIGDLLFSPWLFDPHKILKSSFDIEKYN